MAQPGTVRQELLRCLTDSLHSAGDLAQLFATPEREIEEHLSHLVRTIARTPGRRFVMEPPECLHCGFRFRTRTRLTRPSRCPRCRSERITSPRFGIFPSS